MNKSEFFPTLPLRDIVVFPGMIVPLFVGRDKSIKALNEVMKTSKKIILITQKNAEIDDPNEEDLYSYGCESKILQLLKLPYPVSASTRIGTRVASAMNSKVSRT